MRIRLLLAISIATSSLTLHAQQYTSHHVEGRNVVIENDKGRLVITPYNDFTIKVYQQPL